jgi:hypothetical protein
LAERGLCKPEVRGSNPLASTKSQKRSGQEVLRASATESLSGATNPGTPNRFGNWPPEVEHSNNLKLIEVNVEFWAFS